MDRARDLLLRQNGVVSRRQLLDAGLSENDVRRLLRRRDLTLVHPGVYVDHTGEPAWIQRAWAAVLAVSPAALSHESVLRLEDGPGRPASLPIDVAVARGRPVVAPVGVRLHHLAHLEERVLWNLSPPRVRIEEAVLDVAAGSPSDHDAVGVLTDAVRARRTTAARVREALEARPRVARRDFLLGVLRDVEQGTDSVLEREYLVRVEQAHGLPRGLRQVRDGAGRRTAYRDVEYVEHGVLVELDGRLVHGDRAQRDLDLARDLDAATSGRSTVRLGWGQVVGRPCDTASRVGGLLRLRGWDGVLTSCPECPPGLAAAG